jgi:cell division protein FtsB
VTRSSGKSRGERHTILKISGRARGWWPLILLAGAGILLAVLLVGDKNSLKLLALYQERDRMAQSLDTMKNENEKIKEQIQALKTDPKAVEQLAREELGLVKSQEWVYRFVPRTEPPAKR